MNQIDLFNKEEGEQQKVQVKNDSRIDRNRPQKINTSKVISSNQKWKQCKIIGKNISIRSYSAICFFDNKLFVYGGYQILNGLMSDFYVIDVNDDAQKYFWTQVLNNSQNLPGPRSKHAMVATKDKIYLIGGLNSFIKGSNDIFSFDVHNKKWTKMQPVGDQLPCLDSFGCVVSQREGDEVLIIICGYDSNRSAYSNAVYEYNIVKNKISILFEGSKDDNENKYPTPRSGAACSSDGKNVYIFGGKNQQTRMNDLWMFSLGECKYHRMEQRGIVPAIRNGHTMNFHEGKLYVFGGIHDITWELDDLHIYQISKGEWSTLQHDSARKIQKKSPSKKQGEGNPNKSPDDKKGKKKSWYDTAQTLYGNKSNISSPLQKNTSYRENNESMSPGKMIEQQKKKVFYQKKAELLKTFDVADKEKGRYIQYETSSQAMRNSLDVIGNPNPKQKVPEGKLTDFGKQSVSKFLKPLQNNNNLIVGKRPCARDGHCSAIGNGDLVIFGGDRHQMSFNDIYKLNLEMAKGEIQH